MKIIQGCELETFLHASNQATCTLKHIMNGIRPSTDNTYLLLQYYAIEALYGGSETLQQANQQLKARGNLTPEPFDLQMIKENGLIARACENKLGLGISYGRTYHTLKQLGSNYLAIDRIPNLQSCKWYEQFAGIEIEEVLSRAAIGPAIIEVPPELLNIGIALGLDHRHPESVLRTFDRIRACLKK